MAGLLLRWLPPDVPAPAGYVDTGVVSRWQDTGRIRARLWEAALSGDVRPCAATADGPGPLSAFEPDASTGQPGPFPATGEKRT